MQKKAFFPRHLNECRVPVTKENMLGVDIVGQIGSIHSACTPLAAILSKAGISSPNRSHLNPSKMRRNTLGLIKMRRIISHCLQYSEGHFLLFLKKHSFGENLMTFDPSI